MVLVFAPGLPFVKSLLACLLYGAIAVPVYPPNPQVRKKLLLTRKKLKQDLPKFVKVVESCRAVVALTESTYYNKVVRLTLRVLDWPKLKWRKVEKAKKLPIPEPTEQTCKGSDVAFLQFTSGSTSDPKVGF